MPLILFRTLAISLLFVGVTGCVSVIDVSKAKSDSPGIRYSLPMPFIQVTPNLDGTVNVTPIFLPDPDNEYVIESKAYLGKYTIDINRNEKGFLETVSFNSDSTGVAKQLIQSEAALRTAEIEARAAKDKADQTTAKAATDKEEAAVAAAEKASKDAQLALDVAQRKLEILEQLKGQPGAPQNINDQILAARLTKEEQQIKRDAASVALSSIMSSTAAANAPSNKGMQKAPEPVFFRVDMTKDSVKLSQAFVQSDRETWKAPAQKEEMPELVVLPAKMVVRPNEKNKGLTAIVKANRQLVSADLVDIVATTPVKPPLPKPLFSLREDGITVWIEFPTSTPPGEYEVDGQFISGPPNARQSDKRSFLVRIEQ